MHWDTAGAPDAAAAGVAARPPNVSNEMEPTAAKTTVSSALLQCLPSRAPDRSLDALPFTAIGSLIRIQAIWNSLVMRPWPKLRTIPPSRAALWLLSLIHICPLPGELVDLAKRAVRDCPKRAITLRENKRG